MSTPIVFFDIAGPDLAAQSGFYSAVFGWKVGPGGSLTLDVQKPLMGLLRVDPAERVLYLGVPDIAATLSAVVAHGGQVVAPRFEVPGRAVLGLFTDPAGNRMGLVEMDGDSARIP